MPLKKSLNEIKKDISHLKKYESVVYGSYAEGKLTPRSDIDVAVISRKQSYQEEVKVWHELLGKAPAGYDLKVFELLPLGIKMGVIENYKVIFGDRGEISEYFYHFRKLWQDVKFRFEENQFSSFKEKLALLRRAKRAGFSG